MKPAEANTGTPLRVLVVEDFDCDAELMMLRLRDEGFAFDWQRVETEAEYRQALIDQPNLILADWRLPRFSGSRALQILRELGLDIPFIIVSGGVGEEAAIDAVHQGAADYVLKDRPARLGTAVRRALEQKQLKDERRRAEEELRLADRVFRSSGDGIMLTDADGRIIAVNQAFTQITGYEKEEALGRNPRFLQSGRQDADFYRAMWQTLTSAGQWRGEVWNRRKNGEIYPEWLTLTAVRDETGRDSHFVGIFSDISSVKDAQQMIDFLAHHDPLTRLPNRNLFHDRLSHGLERARRDLRPLALLFFDLDRFKNVNDTLGHPVGDALLLAAAERVSAQMRAGDTLARLGGDEFLLLLEDEADSHATAAVARKLLDVFATPFQVRGHELSITASIGISLFPGDGDDADALLKNADRAMYEAKAKGRNTYQFFEPGLSAGVLERLILENALRGAIARGELSLHYQPQVRLADGALTGAEALARWQHPELGAIPPSQFIALAEEMGVIKELGAWVLAEACRQVAQWQTQDFVLPRVAVNLSVRQIERDTLLNQVSAALADAGLSPQRLELEVTESMMMTQPELAQSVLASLMDRGVQLAVDDFGTGYSSLAYLKRLSLHRLKIDQGFVADIGRNSNSEAIIRAVIALSRSLGLETIAEGVETPAQAEFLKAEGCDIAQGYLYARPLPADVLFATWNGKAPA